MRWRGLESSSNVQDRRGMSRGRAATGAGGLGIIGILIALFFGGGEGGGLGAALESLAAPQSTIAQTIPDGPGDDAFEFVGAVLGTNETLWEGILASGGLQYRDAQLVLFSGSTQSGCGGATSQVGPHYCSLDETIYIDLGFFDELQTRFGASGDFAQAYVISHEFAHHMLNVLGISGQVQNLSQQDPGERNKLSVSLELQADCFAGVWANSMFQRGDVLEPGDIEEALSAAAAVGDDRIQSSVNGRIDPETWTHGSSEQRVDWFSAGYTTGDANQCDTFG